MLPLIGLGVIGIILLIIVGAFFSINLAGTWREEAEIADSGQSDSRQAESLSVAADAVDPASDLPIGYVTNCQQNPAFSTELGFASVAIDTSRSRGAGLVLFDFEAADTYAKENTYQHETWDEIGDIGSYTLDGDGNIYVAPFPHIDLLENPPEAQNTIHRIDTKSGEMSKFIALPAAQPPSTQSPFGIVALTYDCEAESLYAASLAGSTRYKEVGRIFQINIVESDGRPAKGDVVSQLEGIDPYGIGVFNGKHGKRLYFGHGRSGAIYSVPLDSTGAFQDQPRQELSLAPLYEADALVARRITFRETNMKIDGFKFQYNLVPMAEQGPRPSFRFVYDADADSWHFIEMNRDDL